MNGDTVERLRESRILHLVSLALLAACGFSEEPSRLLERSDSTGIEIVHVLRAPADRVRLDTPLVRIGSTGMEGAEHELFQLISDLALLPDGRVAVVDNRGVRVAVFDSTGVWLYDIGRPGEGPGEYTAPIYASVRGDTLFVWDALQRRMSRYTAEGSFVGSVLAFAQRTSSHPFVAVPGGYIMELESGQLIDPAPARGALVRTRRDGAVIDTLVGPYPVPERGWVITNDETGMGQMVNPPALAIYPPWTVAHGFLIWLDPLAVSVEVRSLETGGVERIIRLPYEAALPTASAQDAYFDALQAEFGYTDESTARRRIDTQFAELRPPVAGVLMDDRGRLWVAEHDPAARARGYIGSGWDVIDVAREHASHFEFGEGFELKAIRGGRAYGITTLETGVHVVDVFRLPSDRAM